MTSPRLTPIPLKSRFLVRSVNIMPESMRYLENLIAPCRFEDYPAFPSNFCSPLLGESVLLIFFSNFDKKSSHLEFSGIFLNVREAFQVVFFLALNKEWNTLNDGIDIFPKLLLIPFIFFLRVLSNNAHAYVSSLLINAEDDHEFLSFIFDWVGD